MSALPYFLQKTFLTEESGVFHGFFGRRGGVSEGIYASLNCGLGSADALENVIQNRTRVAQEMGVGVNNLLSLYQVHGKECVLVEKPWTAEERPKADAFVTDRPGIALGILTADCAPILFYGVKPDGGPVIGAAHAGWKGALANVFAETIAAMESLTAKRETIKACIGPCIAKASYEVSGDFAEPFLEEHDESGRFFQTAKKERHLMFDLPGYCAWRLFREGVRSIMLMDQDTYARPEDFFSYRRSTHAEEKGPNGEKDYGRQISVIAIKAVD